MARMKSLTAGSCLFDVGGTKYIIGGFMPKKFIGIRAQQVHGLWYLMDEAAELDSLTITHMIYADSYELVTEKNEGATPSEVDRWHDRPYKLDPDRLAGIEAHYRAHYAVSDDREERIAQCREHDERLTQQAEALLSTVE